MTKFTVKKDNFLKCLKIIAVVGKCKNENKIGNCFGEIEILSVDDEHKTAYASWQIFNENKIGIAGTSKSYYFGEVNNPQEELLKIILIDIQKYTMNRQKVFTDIQIK